MIKELYESKLYKTDKFTGHQYMETYKKVLNPRKNTAKNILEIGVKAGGSVLLWRDFFTNAKIYGIDIDGMPEDLVNNNERITIIKDNAYDLQFIHNNFVSKGIKFDVLIDDGPHSLESMMFFAKHYSALMADGGVMVIEDIPDLNWTIQIAQSLPMHLRPKAQAVCSQYRENIGRWEDVLFILDT